MNPPLDRDGFPPCTMTVDEFCAHIRETFTHPDHRVIAFKVRVYGGGTLTTQRGEMGGMRANKIQVEACRESVRLADAGKPEATCYDIGAH